MSTKEQNQKSQVVNWENSQGSAHPEIGYVFPGLPSIRPDQNSRNQKSAQNQIAVKSETARHIDSRAAEKRAYVRGRHMSKEHGDEHERPDAIKMELSTNCRMRFSGARLQTLIERRHRLIVYARFSDYHCAEKSERALILQANAYFKPVYLDVKGASSAPPELIFTVEAPNVR